MSKGSSKDKAKIRVLKSQVERLYPSAIFASAVRTVVNWYSNSKDENDGYFFVNADKKMLEFWVFSAKVGDNDMVYAIDLTDCSDEDIATLKNLDSQLDGARSQRIWANERDYNKPCTCLKG